MIVKMKVPINDSFLIVVRLNILIVLLCSAFSLMMYEQILVSIGVPRVD